MQTNNQSNQHPQQSLKEIAAKVASTSHKIWIGSGEDIYALSHDQENQNELANA